MRPRTQVLGNEREDEDDCEDKQVFGARVGFGAGDVDLSEDRARRRADDARGAVIVEPREFVEDPDQEELRGEGRHGEVEALDPEAGETEQHADERGDETGGDKDDDDVEPGKRGRQLVGRKGADRHKAAGAERHLPGIAGQQIEPERRQRVDEERDHDRQEPVFRAYRRDHQIGDGERRECQPAVLADRKDRLVGGVAGLELADLAVDHRRFIPAR